MKAPAAACRAVPLALVAVYLIFSQSITGTFVLAAFLLESMARFMRGYSWTINWSVKLVHGPLAS